MKEKCFKCNEKSSSHTCYHKGEKARLCCQCFIAAGGIPADWHLGCMAEMKDEDIEKIEAINESPNSVITVLANLMWETQRQHILALNNLCDVAEVMMGKFHGTQLNSS